MTSLHRWLTRVREWMTRTTDADMTAELESHLDHLTDDYMRRGLSREAAVRAARRDFGALESAKESVRDTRGFRGLDNIGQDVRYAVRNLFKAPAFSFVAIATLALGVGANTAIFSLVDAVMLKPLPYVRSDRLVSVWERGIGGQDSNGRVVEPRDRMTVSAANAVDYQRVQGFSQLAAYDTVNMTLTHAGAPESVNGEAVSASYFVALGGNATIGRTLQVQDEDARAPRVVVLSDALWRRRFGADPGVVGSTIQLNTNPWQVVGVMPPDFRGLSSFEAATTVVEYWTPTRFDAALLTDDARGDHDIKLVARLRDGVTVDAINRDLDGLSQQLAARFPDTNGQVRALSGPLARDLARDARASLIAVFTIVGLILLIACVNVANLLIVRGVSRKREIAIRLALGAARSRVIRGLLTESVVLAACGGAAGLAIGYWVQRALISLAPANTPRLDQVALDGRVLLAALVITLCTGLVFGLFPAWQASRERPIEALRTTERVVAGTAVMRWRNGLMAVEVALSAILLVGAGLTLRSLVAMNQIPLGFRTDHVLVLNTTLPEERYATADLRLRFFEDLATRLSALPSVEGVGYANRLPLRGGWSSGFQITGVTPPPSGSFECDFQAVSPGYFNVLGIALSRGRALTSADTSTAQPVAVVSEAFSKKLLGGADPIGRTIRRGPNAPLITIVGVVADVRRSGHLAPLAAQVYLPAMQTGSYPVRLSDVAIRTAGDPNTLLPAIQEQLWAIDKDQPITNMRVLDDVLFQRGAPQRFRALLFTICAGLALVLSLIGVYGVVAYSVMQRTPEIGVRMALGASRGGIMRRMVGHTAGLVTVSALVGLGIARLLSSTLESLLFGVTATDWPTYLTAAVALSVVAIGAATLAARRATLIDPVRALRGE